MNGQKDLYHFVLSLVIVIGGGYLWATQRELAGEVGALMGAVVGYWFYRGANGGNGNGNGNGRASALNGTSRKVGG